MENLLKAFLFLSIQPVAWIIYSCLFFWFITEKSEPIKTVLYLKCYCILMMPLAIEALIRSMIYVRDIWGNQEGSVVLIFLIVSLLVLCFSVFTLRNKFASRITRNICFFLALILVSSIIIFPFVSLMFGSSYQIISVWGCIAMALYMLLHYTVPNDEMALLQKERMIKNVFRSCLILSIWILILLFSQGVDPDPGYKGQNIRRYYLSAIIRYRDLHPEIFSELSLTEAVDITDRLDVVSKYINTGAISVVVKNKKYSLQHNIEAWLYCKRGVPLLGFGAYSRCSLESYKKVLTQDSSNYNTPDLDSHYDGIGNVFFRRIN